MAIIRSSKNKKGTRSTHYDTSRNKVLSSYRSSSGRIKHYDKNGRYFISSEAFHLELMTRIELVSRILTNGEKPSNTKNNRIKTIIFHCMFAVSA